MKSPRFQPSHKEVRALTVTEVGALRAGLRQWEANKKQAGRYPTVDMLDVVDIILATGRASAKPSRSAGKTSTCKLPAPQ